MALAEMFIPAMIPSLGVMVADALGFNGANPTQGFIAPEIESQIYIANIEMQDPAFWQAPPTDWQRGMVVGGIGMVLGLVVARQIFDK